MKATKKSALIVAMSVITGASVESTNAAAQAALADMKQELGAENVCSIEYDWNPFDGMIA